MNIYQNLGINILEKANLPVGTIGLEYFIESAQIVENGYGARDVLHMNFREKGKELGTVFGYGLIGENVFNSFMKEMKTEKVEGLVGKVVLAFIPPSDDVVKGISPKK